MFKVIMTVCALALVLLFVLAFPSSDKTESSTLDGTHFVFNNGPEVNSLDPQVISWKHDIRIANALFEGLMTFRVLPPEMPGAAGAVVVEKAAASSYTVSDDALVYTFHIDPAAKWSNGQPLTADDFLWSFKRLMTPLTAGDYAQLMFVIAGARDYYNACVAGEAGDFDSVGVKALDAKTLEVTLAAPCGYFLELLAFPPFFPVYRPLLEANPMPNGPEAVNGIGLYDSAAWTAAGKLVGNGPFMLESHIPRSKLTLIKNPHYRAANSVRLQKITALAIDDNNASLNAYESGSCDLIDILPVATIRELMAMPPESRREDFYNVNSYGTYFYRFNCQPVAAGNKNPFADWRVRKAFALVADKQELVELLGGGQKPAQSFVPPGLTVSDPAGKIYEYPHIDGLTRDIQQAKKLLADAGYADPKLLGEIVLLYNSGADHELPAQRMKNAWQTHLGVSVQLAGIDANAFGQKLKQKQDKSWHIARSAWFGDYRDPSNFLEMFQSDNGNNDCAFSDEHFDELISTAAASSDQGERMQLLSEAERIVIEQKPAILPLYHYCEYYLIRPKVKGAYPNAFGYVLLGDVYLEP